MPPTTKRKKGGGSIKLIWFGLLVCLLSVGTAVDPSERPSFSGLEKIDDISKETQSLLQKTLGFEKRIVITAPNGKNPETPRYNPTETPIRNDCLTTYMLELYEGVYEWRRDVDKFVFKPARSRTPLSCSRWTDQAWSPVTIQWMENEKDWEEVAQHTPELRSAHHGSWMSHDFKGSALETDAKARGWKGWLMCWKNKKLYARASVPAGPEHSSDWMQYTNPVVNFGEHEKTAILLNIFAVGPFYEKQLFLHKSIHEEVIAKQDLLSSKYELREQVLAKIDALEEDVEATTKCMGECYKQMAGGDEFLEKTQDLRNKLFEYNTLLVKAHALRELIESDPHSQLYIPVLDRAATYHKSTTTRCRLGVTTKNIVLDLILLFIFFFLSPPHWS